MFDSIRTYLAEPWPFWAESYLFLGLKSKLTHRSDISGQSPKCRGLQGLFEWTPLELFCHEKRM